MGSGDPTSGASPELSGRSLAPARWARTLRHLRADQLAHRLRYRLRRSWWERRSHSIDASYRARAAGLPGLRWKHPGLARVAAWRRSARGSDEHLASAEAVLAGRFSYLGRSEDLGQRVDWFRPDLDSGTRLWKTLLHEFGFAEDLACAGAATAEPRFRERLFELARSWREAAPIGCRDFALDAWNARAVATRLIHWAVAGATLDLGEGDPDADWLGREIGLHGLFLRDNLELDLRGNHLFRDAVGLVFAQTLVGGVPDAWEWLERVVVEQVLADGCHEERAPFYHAVCTRDLLEVRLLAGEESPRWLDDALARMAAWLESITLGDAGLPRLGDGGTEALDIPALLEATRREVSLGTPLAPERHGGLVSLRAGAWCTVVRAGPHAPDEQMGHAHADLLSFEASLGPRRVLSDTGTLLYDAGPERQRIRGTAAHNTLRLDGVEQLEAWGSFRVGRRGRARAHGRGQWEAPEGTWQWLAASHDAYTWLPGGPRHHRLWLLTPEGLAVLDAVLGSGRHRIESFMHQHPDAEAAGAGLRALGQAAQIEPAPLHEHFGETREMRRHRVEQNAELPWLGGWWIGSEGAARGPSAPVLEGSAIVVRIDSSDTTLTWRPHATDAQDSVAFCSASGGSAT